MSYHWRCFNTRRAIENATVVWLILYSICWSWCRFLMYDPCWGSSPCRSWWTCIKGHPEHLAPGFTGSFTRSLSRSVIHICLKNGLLSLYHVPAEPSHRTNRWSGGFVISLEAAKSGWQMRKEETSFCLWSDALGTSGRLLTVTESSAEVLAHFSRWRIHHFCAVPTE